MKKSLGPKTILYPHPVLLVGTYGKDGQPNLATVAWGGIVCSKPPSVGVSLREATLSYHNIHHHKAFTVNIPSVKFIRESDYAGIASGKNVNKFEKTGLTAVKSELVEAPYVAEFPLVLECRLTDSVSVGLHTQFIGEILDLKADEDVLGKKDLPDITKVNPFLYATGNMAYFGIGEMLQKAFVTKEM
jgi:flavin reductase (DIM6/NTAB) family NADH-FMN oxidoreductase RutF